jgi:hypothetical protein
MARTIERKRQRSGEAAPGAAQARDELLQRFGALGGVTARSIDLALVMPDYTLEVVEQALRELVEAGMVERALLSDGTAIFHFPRR